MANRKHVLHIKSNVVNEVDGQKIPKRPLPEDLLEGEIAVNYGAGGELLTIKNSEGDIVGFVNENDFEQLEDTTMAALAGLRQLIDDFTIIVPSNGNLAGHQHNTGSLAEGDRALAINDGTKAEGKASFASGDYTTASGSASHAEGSHTTATGASSHAEGYQTTASGHQAHAGGIHSKATAQAAFAHGDNTIADNPASAAFGSFNKSTSGKTKFAVGGGTAENNRLNLFEVQSDGAILIKNGDTYDVNLQETFSNLKNVTYSELKSLRDNSALIPGQQYRITDYVTTTTQVNTQSANHAFDVIVTATDVNTLNENAKVIKHEGDTYFAKANLNAWEIKYTIDNNDEKYQWADKTNGKGVIYYMKDENANECPYDFKNIMFKRWAYSDVQSDELTTEDINKLKSTFVYNSSTQPIHYSETASNRRVAKNTNLIVDTQNSEWYYTFSIVDNGAVKDASILDLYGNTAYEFAEAGTLNNVILPREMASNDIEGDSDKVYYALNNITLIGKMLSDQFEGFVSNKFDTGCWYITCGSCTNFNRFDGSCSGMLLGYGNCSNTFGVYSYDNTLVEGNMLNEFKEFTNNNLLINGCRYNNFLGDCWKNILRGGNYYNTFGNACSYNKIGNNSKHNSFGNNCMYNEIGENCNSNSFGNSCGKKENDVIKKNTIGNNSSNNSFGNDCYDNILGVSCNSNSFGNECYQNQLASTCSNNSFDNKCYNNKLLTGQSSSNTFGNGCYSNTFEMNCNNNSFGIGCYQNHLGEGSNRNDLGNVCYLNNFGPTSKTNSFGNACHHNEFGSIEEEIGTMSNNVLGNGCEYIVFDKDYTENVVVESGNRRITLTTDQTTSNTSRLRNIHIALGVNSSSTVKTITHTTVNDKFETRYQSANSITINV